MFWNVDTDGNGGQKLEGTGSSDQKTEKRYHPKLEL